MQFLVWLSCPWWCSDWGYGPDSAELFGGGVQFLDKVVDVPVAVHVEMLKTVEVPQLQHFDKVVDVLVCRSSTRRGRSCDRAATS